MILNIDEIKQASNYILNAVDSSEISILTETLELITNDGMLFMNVTNKECYTRVKIKINSGENFHATVNASRFLRLIAQTTTETVELRISGNNLIVKGNGDYKIPLIYDGEELLALPEINIVNETASFDMSSDILADINFYNSKELSKGVMSKPVQKMYYIDNQGCITFTSGACVNAFTLPTTVKFLLPQRVVKLFKLLKDEQIKVTLGHDPISEEIIQTKIRFESSNVIITAILSCDDTMLNSVPAAAIRSRADNTYPYSVTLNKNELLETVSRLMIFCSEAGGKAAIKPYCKFKFDEDSLTIFDIDEANNEVIYYETVINMETPYEASLDLLDLKSTLDGVNSSHITLNFGDGKAVVMKRANISVVIPECKSI